DCGVGVLHTRYAAGTKPELTRLNTCCAVDSLNLLQYVSRSPVKLSDEPILTGAAQLDRKGFKCPVCSKSVAPNEMEVHFIMCLSKPRLSYNGADFK
ncbi:E3 ubiquitin-protein ligase znrf1 isoform X2, partial [Tachysurus ichikawai]